MLYRLNKKHRAAFVGLAPAPWTGWGIYAKQLCMALVSQGLAWPYTYLDARKTAACGYEWSLLSEQMNTLSLEMFGSLPAEKYDHDRVFDYVFHGFGNGLHEVNKLPLNGKRKVAVGFFEVSNLGDDLVDYLNRFDLVVAGSTWNKNVLVKHGLSRVVRVIQGVDTAVFNPIPVPRILHASIIIFSGGKLEFRKGQDIVVDAFKKLLHICPDALLIASWGNESPSVSTISLSPYVTMAPVSGDAEEIANWLEAQGIPRRNFVVPGILNSAQISSLIKQSDLAVFPNRCEGGTNLVAMEAIACGIPTVLSTNSGHLDLMRLGFPQIIPIPTSFDKKLSFKDQDNFKVWGDSDPDFLLKVFVDCLQGRLQLNSSSQKLVFERLHELSWQNSFKMLFSAFDSVALS